MGILIGPPGQPTPLAPGEFESGSIPNIVSFSFEHLSPPTPLYIQRDDVLIIEGISTTGGEIFTLTARLLLTGPPTPSQPQDLPAERPIPQRTGGPAYIEVISQTLIIAAINTPQILVIPLAEGYLLSVAAIASAAVGGGSSFVVGMISRAQSSTFPLNPASVLFADYVTTRHPVGWPGGRAIASEEGAGGFLTQTIGNPAPGADWTFTIPTAQRWLILTASGQLATSATVASRIPRIQITDTGGTVNWQSGPSQTIPASTTAQVSAGAGQVTVTTDAVSVNQAIPGIALMQGAEIIRVSTTNIQGADQWSNVRIRAIRWVAGA